MIIRENILSTPELHSLTGTVWEKAAFFDIETTGLGWRSSHINLIGVLYCTQGKWVMRQWFLKHPFSEKEMLQSFSDFLAEREQTFLVDYNGDTFDIPYLCNKYTFYAMPVPAQLQKSGTLPHRDLMTALRPLKSRLPFSSLRLQEVEACLHADRTDASSGKDLIEVYQSYLLTGDEELAAQLFRHNYDDVRGLCSVLPLLRFRDFWNGAFEVSSLQDEGDYVLFELTSEKSFPLSYTLRGTCAVLTENVPEETSTEVCTISFCGDKAHLTIPVSCGECKVFFEDYRNYYYLPGEDRAIHKSVGVYVDAAFRVQAKASNCYQRVQDRFLSLPSASSVSGIPCFCSKYKDKSAWVRVNDLISGESDLQKQYVQSALTVF